MIEPSDNKRPWMVSELHQYIDTEGRRIDAHVPAVAADDDDPMLTIFVGHGVANAHQTNGTVRRKQFAFRIEGATDLIDAYRKFDEALEAEFNRIKQQMTEPKIQVAGRMPGGNGHGRIQT